MELIRNKLDRLAKFLQSQQPELEDYFRTFPNAPIDAAQATSRFVDGLNEVIVYIASSIAQSCKNGSSSDTGKDSLQYSPEEVSKACKIKAKMEQIRYAFLCPSPETHTQITQIQAFMQAALELCPNQFIYTHFKGATKGRNFDIDEPLDQNKAKGQVRGEENEISRLKMKEEKIILYEEVSKHLHTEQQKKRKEEKYKAISPIKASNSPHTVNGHFGSSQRIFSGQKKQCLLHRKKYNYLQAFEREEQRLKDQAKYVILNSSKTGKQVSTVSTHQGSKSIEKVSTQQQQRKIEITDFQLGKDGDSMSPKFKQAQPPPKSPYKASTGVLSPQKNQDLHEATTIIAS